MQTDELKGTTITTSAGEMIVDQITSISILLKAKKSGALGIFIGSASIIAIGVLMLLFLGTNEGFSGSFLEKAMLATFAIGIFGIVKGLNSVNKATVGFYFSKNWILIKVPGAGEQNLKFTDIKSLDITKTKNSYIMEFPDTELPKITTELSNRDSEYPPIVQFFIDSIKRYNKQIIINEKNK